MKYVYGVMAQVGCVLLPKGYKRLKIIKKSSGLYLVALVNFNKAVVYYNTLNDAKIGRNEMEFYSIHCGNEIIKFRVKESSDGVCLYACKE